MFRVTYLCTSNAIARSEASSYPMTAFSQSSVQLQACSSCNSSSQEGVRGADRPGRAMARILLKYRADIFMMQTSLTDIVTLKPTWKGVLRSCRFCSLQMTFVLSSSLAEGSEFHDSPPHSVRAPFSSGIIGQVRRSPSGILDEKACKTISRL